MPTQTYQEKAIVKLSELVDSENEGTAMFAAKELLKATAVRRCQKCGFRLVPDDPNPGVIEK